MKLKKLLVGTVLLTSLGLMVGCNGNESDISNSEGEKTELTIATWANVTEAKEFDEILDKLNAQSDSYVLKQMTIPQDYYTKIQTMIAGNSAPDLFWLAQEHIPAYAQNNAVLDLTNQLKEQDTVNMNDYFSGSLDTAEWEGQIYGLPWIGQPYVVYYNKEIFDKNGIGEPSLDWTWDDFEDTAKKVTKDNVYGFANTGSLPPAVLAWGYGGELVTTKGIPEVNSDKTVEGLEKYYQISVDQNMTMPYTEASSLGVEQGFVNGDIAMMIGGANDDIEKKVEEAGGAFEVGMAVMPAGKEKQVTFNWTASTLISSQTKNSEVAFDALLDVTNAMFDWKVPAPVKSKSEKIAEINHYKEYATDVIDKSMEISRGFNNMPQQNELGAKQWELLDLPIISDNNGKGNVDITEIADTTQKEFEKILGK